VRALPEWRAFGLRGRIVGAVLITAIATLAVAALTLLGPLETSLKREQQASMKNALGPKTIDRFADLHLYNVVYLASVRRALRAAQGSLDRRLAASTVEVYGDAGIDGTASQLLVPSEDPLVENQAHRDVDRAFRTGEPDYSVETIDDKEYIRAAIPFTSYDPRTKRPLLYVLAVRKSIAEIPEVVRVVRRAFVDAALAGLALSLILGIPLSARLVRRLRRLRVAALELAHEGPGVEVPVDRARDEVGDLARTLATMQQRLRQQEQARRSFVATASHELRTPLASLDGMLELLDDDLGDDEPDLQDARALLARARAQSRRLGRLAADLLDLSRIDAQVQLRSEPVELGELGRAVLAEFELGTAERRIGLRLQDPGRAIWALGDPGSVARILRILLDNAVRVSAPDTEVTVALRQAGRIVTVAVGDQGPGVEPGEREAIFLRFHRGSDTSRQGGFGLGLAIGRELAERMGGTLAMADGDPPGATFLLSLPSAPLAGAKPAATEAGEPLAASGGGALM
jgi:signal transduction histidine kinase